MRRARFLPSCLVERVEIYVVLEVTAQAQDLLYRLLAMRCHDHLRSGPEAVRSSTEKVELIAEVWIAASNSSMSSSPPLAWTEYIPMVQRVREDRTRHTSRTPVQATTTPSSCRQRMMSRRYRTSPLSVVARGPQPSLHLPWRDSSPQDP